MDYYLVKICDKLIEELNKQIYNYAYEIGTEDIENSRFLRNYPLVFEKTSSDISFTINLKLCEVSYECYDYKHRVSIQRTIPVFVLAIGDIFKIHYYLNSNETKKDPKLEKVQYFDSNNNSSQIYGIIKWKEYLKIMERAKLESFNELFSKNLIIDMWYLKNNLEPKKALERFLFETSKISTLIIDNLNNIYTSKDNGDFSLHFDEPKSLYEAIKLLTEGNYKISKIIFRKLNKTEQNILEKMPNVYVDSALEIPDTLPIFAYRKLYFSSFSQDDVANIDTRIYEYYYRLKWDRKLQQITPEQKASGIPRRTTKYRCYDGRRCDICYPITTKQEKQRKIKTQMEEQIEDYYNNFL